MVAQQSWGLLSPDPGQTVTTSPAKTLQPVETLWFSIAQPDTTGVHMLPVLLLKMLLQIEKLLLEY